jgi:hypothetical protein
MYVHENIAVEFNKRAAQVDALAFGNPWKSDANATPEKRNQLTFKS